ncbi:hypothetical protein RHMOL_Rhmol01G0204900 [Rhododendron molle]|uniref:Uncharacterized protein n=1 Tax=Rhododendron molle TaxID=49168 RepID=A0ACC0Q383_RHOML|nr:hypothetical protein RHMOL_Rhmol01G0204900 [Rhododendron molle]
MKTCENEMPYLMTLLECLFVIEISASADQSYSVIEIRDLMFEAFAAYQVVMNLIAEDLAVATVRVAIESVTRIAAVVLTVDPGLATRWLHSGGFVAAVESLIVVACAQSGEWSACWSYHIDSQAIAAAAAAAAAVVVVHPYSTWHPTAAADAYLIGCFAGPSAAAVAAAG